jgi:hypothetical protein
VLVGTRVSVRRWFGSTRPGLGAAKATTMMAAETIAEPPSNRQVLAPSRVHHAIDGWSNRKNPGSQKSSVALPLPWVGGMPRISPPFFRIWGGGRQEQDGDEDHEVQQGDRDGDASRDQGEVRKPKFASPFASASSDVHGLSTGARGKRSFQRVVTCKFSPAGECDHR